MNSPIIVHITSHKPKRQIQYRNIEENIRQRHANEAASQKDRQIALLKDDLFYQLMGGVMPDGGDPNDKTDEKL